MSLLQRRKKTAPNDIRSIHEIEERLPSKDPYFWFTARIRVEWSVGVAPPLGTPQIVAAASVLDLVGAGVADVSVLQVSAAEQRAERAVATCLPRSVDGVRVHRARVDLWVDDATLRTAHELEGERREQQLESARQERMRSRMRFLREDVLRDPVSARIYWLMEHRDRGDALMPPEALNDLVREANSWRPNDRWVTIAQLLHQFVESLSEGQRNLLVERLGDLLQFYGRGDLATQLLDDAPTLSTSNHVDSSASPLGDTSRQPHSS